MSYVIDASVFVKVLVREPGSSEAEAVLRHPVMAPDLLLAECLNALRAKVLRKEIARAQASVAVELLQQSPLTLESSLPVAARALELSLRLWQSVYDCVYLALAERHQVPLVTADARMVERLRQPDAADLAHLAQSLYEPLQVRVQERVVRPYMARRRMAAREQLPGA